MRFLQEHFGLEPERAIRTVGLPRDFMTLGERPVTADEYYNLWNALDEQVVDPAFPAKMARKIVEKGTDSSVHSFYSSPNVRVGLQRKALLKPLLMPIRMTLTDYELHLALSFGTALPSRPLPALIGWFNLAYFVLAIRDATGVSVTPAAVEAANLRDGWDDKEEFFGVPISHGTGYRLILRGEDANRPLVTRNDTLWNQIEVGLKDRFQLSPTPESTVARVRAALIEGLAGGQATADEIARALALSKRSLQRRLNEEGMSFKEVLEDTRRALAMNYLLNSDMSVQEIAYLLGFQDPSSFFRAFRSWTGQTPQSVRQKAA